MADELEWAILESLLGVPDERRDSMRGWGNAQPRFQYKVWIDRNLALYQNKWTLLDPEPSDAKQLAFLDLLELVRNPAWRRNHGFPPLDET